MKTDYSYLLFDLVFLGGIRLRSYMNINHYANIPKFTFVGDVNWNLPE